jgi:LmbE family N-acetylglucosaminyl deacetylase
VSLALIDSLVFAPVRGVLRLRAGDMTDQAAGRSCLVIAPHADDETLGCGATIARKRAAGKRVRVVIVTDGRRSHDSAKVTVDQLIAMRRTEAVDACGALGVPAGDVVFLDCEDQTVGEHTADVASWLAALVEESGPDEVLSPSGLDRNVDHQALCEIVRSLIRDGRITCPVYEYPVWFWTLRTWAGRGPVGAGSIPKLLTGPLRAALTPSPQMVRTDGFLDLKRAALAKHRSQMENLSGEASWGTLDRRFVRGFFKPYELFFAVYEKGGPQQP